MRGKERKDRKKERKDREGGRGGGMNYQMTNRELDKGPGVKVLFCSVLTSRGGNKLSDDESN